MSLHHCKTFRWPPPVRFFVYKTENSNWSTASTALNHKEHYRKQMYYVTRKKKRLRFLPMYFLTGIHRLLLTIKGRSARPSATHCLGLMQIPQKLCVHRMRERTSTVAKT